jgi:hypothetical protein
MRLHFILHSPSNFELSFCFGLIFFFHVFFRPNLCLSLNSYCDLLIYKFLQKSAACLLHVRNFKSFIFEGSNSPYQLIFKWICFHCAQIVFSSLQMLHSFQLLLGTLRSYGVKASKCE